MRAAADLPVLSAGLKARSSKTNHKPADMQQAYPEANTKLVEQVSKMTSKHEKERAREEPDKRTNENPVRV